MPKQGYKTITVSEEVHSKLEECANQRFQTVPKLIEYLISSYCEKEVR